MVPVSLARVSLNWIVGCLAALTLSVGPGRGQEALLELSVTRELTETERNLLSEIIVQNNSAMVLENRDEVGTFAEICDPITCQVPATNAVNDLWTQATDAQPRAPNVLNEFTRGLVIPGEISRDGRDYFVIEPDVAVDGTVLGAVPGRYNSTDLSRWMAFPLNTESQIIAPDILTEWSFTPPASDGLVLFWEPKSVPFTIISNDLSYSGESDRVFSVRKDVADERLAEVLAALQANDIGANVVQESNTSLVRPIVSPFEGEGASCNGGQVEDDWPFDPAEIRAIISQNREWLGRLRLPVSRALLLVVDTGIGEKLIEEGGQLSGLLAPKQSEVLNPLIVFNDLPETPGALECSDIDGDGYYWDAIGATGTPTALGAVECPFDSVEPLRDHRLFPIPLSIGAADIATYAPGHGSFVSMLVAGGGKLRSSFPELADHIGLRFFKVTRRPEPGSSASVRVEKSALTNALTYAAAQGIDIVNLSMRTSDTNIRRIFENAAVMQMLIVTSAGNLRQDLDNNGAQTLPASLKSTNLIVVGALKNNEGNPWWEDSAFGQSVSIAAPGVGIESVDEEGSKVCFTGTSAAAPTVSFTAALIHSFGISAPGSIKDRILYSTKYDKALEGKVEQARMLDVAASIDVFVDRLALGSGQVMRGRILEDQGVGARLVKLCSGAQGEPLAANGGRIDPFYLKSWRRDGNQIVFQDSKQLTTSQLRCTFDSSTTINFQALGSDAASSVELANIASAVLSPFRSGLVEEAVLDY
ncbi:S8 family serine peptidase [Meridianimarinicoccus zhengii]|uniref:S8 family serine peptidase n=1 Tax=Meridianimarinicoccus zhengii TaxID=2056810 RepID=UPI0013A69B6A|nr:S8 family serine peptidase [Phycocomes zhengii]